MRYATIEGMPFEASRVCLGGGPLGSAVKQPEANALLDEFVSCGGNWVDTAHVYAAWIEGGSGLSERCIAEWLRSRGVRKQFMVATKGAHPDLKTMHIPRMRPEDIAQDLAESLERLGSDYADLYYLHRDDTNIPVGEVISCLNEHRSAGRIRAFGASNWTAARMREANAWAKANGMHGFSASSVGWSLAQPNPITPAYAGTLNMDDEMLLYHREGFPVAAYSSQAAGFFNKVTPVALKDDKFLASGLARNYLNDTNLARAEKARQLAEKYGCDANAIGVAYLLNQPFPSFAIAGSHTLEQVRSSTAAADIILTPEEVAWLVEA
ncbi:MAG: aldo/keto reductase [Chloroflexi bacterium]|nr:aldo/keto reductase [Chloroflexota bacterium]